MRYKNKKQIIIFLSVLFLFCAALSLNIFNTKADNNLLYHTDFENGVTDMLLGEDLSDGGTGWNGYAMPVADGVEVINGAYSMKIWVNDIGAWKQIAGVELPKDIVGNESYYTVNFKYRWLSTEEEFFGTIKFDNSLYGIGFNGNGVNSDHIINIGDEGCYESVDLGDGVIQLTLVMKSNSSDKAVYFSCGEGGGEYIIDDIYCYEGIYKEFTDLKTDKYAFTLNSSVHSYGFEEELAGYNAEPTVAQISWENDSPISGNASMKICVDSLNVLNQVMNKSGDGGFLKANTYYTMQFKVKVHNIKQIMVIPCNAKSSWSNDSRRAEFCFDFENIKQIPCYGTDNFTYQYIESKDYYILSFGFYSLTSGYYDLWKAESNGDGAYFLLDDILFIEGANIANSAEYPSITFAGVRPDKGYVTYQVSLPNAMSRNIENGIEINVIKPNGERFSVDFTNRKFTPDVAGEYVVEYSGCSKSGLRIKNTFTVNILPIPSKPTISVGDAYIQDLEESYVNSIIIIPQADYTDDEDGFIEINVYGPNDFYAGDRFFLAIYAGEYTAKYTAVNGIGVATEYELKFTVKEKISDNAFEKSDKNFPDIEEKSNHTILMTIAVSVAVLVLSVTVVLIVRKYGGKHEK